jgi:hypothetical protein
VRPHAGILLGVCGELVRLCHLCLAREGSMRDCFTAVFRFILGQRAGQGFDSFATPILPFGVFAVLSKITDAFRKYSLVYDCLHQTLSYVTDLRSDCAMLGWKLPVTPRPSSP